MPGFSFKIWSSTLANSVAFNNGCFILWLLFWLVQIKALTSPFILLMRCRQLIGFSEINKTNYMFCLHGFDFEKSQYSLCSFFISHYAKTTTRSHMAGTQSLHQIYDKKFMNSAQKYLCIKAVLCLSTIPVAMKLVGSVWACSPHPVNDSCISFTKPLVHLLAYAV